MDAIAERATRMAGLVAGLGQPAWHDDLAALGGGQEDEPPGGVPTYGDLARGGTALVAGLAEEEQWSQAAAQARHLKRFFAATGMALGPIAVQAFDGLLAACLARDRDELGDFVDLVDEMFP